MKDHLLKAVRGMKDGLPKSSAARRIIASEIIHQTELFNYVEIKLPIVEYTEVFNRGIGADTDVIKKEMYSFQDRNDEWLSLRPEGTAGCVRAVIENNLLISSPLRLFYFGEMFRYERPQKGRQRQFTQFGFELFGVRQVYAEFEIICMMEEIWRALGLEHLSLEINSLGSEEDRTEYTLALKNYFNKYSEDFDHPTKETFERNPLRLLDSKNPVIKELKNEAPKISEFISNDSRQRINCLEEILESNGITTKMNPHLVRGLDYYSDIVFEWKTTRLGAQDAVCAGGRYDRLIEKMGGKSNAAVGCAIGFDRVLALLNDTSETQKEMPKVYVTATSDNLDNDVLRLWKTIRNEIPNHAMLLHLNQGSLKSRLKRADKSGAKAVIIIGESELKNNELIIKPLRHNDEQITCKHDQVSRVLSNFLQER